MAKEPIDPDQVRREAIKLYRETADYLADLTPDEFVDLVKEIQRRKRPPAA